MAIGGTGKPRKERKQLSTHNLELNESLLAYTDLIRDGADNAISGLSQMLGHDVAVTVLKASRIPVGDIPDLFGGQDAVTVGVYLAVTGAANGHMLLIYPPPIALGLADLLMGESVGTTQSLDEMESSALGEMGNIMGSFFLNTLSDLCSLELMPSPPAVMMDMAGAILSAILADISQESDETLIVEASFSVADEKIDGVFAVMPSPDLLRVLLEHCATS